MRISAGDARGVRLRVPPGARPTSERVRAAVLASLAASLPGARVLDLYCGSGAWGLEALSRGADEAVLVDANPAALRAARENARAAGLEAHCRFRRRDAAGYLARQAARDGPFDLVFADPPYAAGPPPLADLARSVAPGGRVVVEARRTSTLPAPAGLRLEAERRYGDTRVLVFRREPT